jgi:excisionase family DNA binding protein
VLILWITNHDRPAATRGARPAPAASPGGPRPTPGVEPRFYTLEDVATILNVRVAQVYALVRSGELPAVKLGGRGVWRVDRQQLETYIERMHEQTADWARKHPLIGAPEEA